MTRGSTTWKKGSGSKLGLQKHPHLLLVEVVKLQCLETSYSFSEVYPFATSSRLEPSVRRAGALSEHANCEISPMCGLCYAHSSMVFVLYMR